MTGAKTCFILNSRAGKRGCQGIIKTVKRYFPKAEIVFTEKPGHGALLAQRAQESGAELIVACGGDGTVHEVVNGLKLPDPKLKLGIVPLGTGNALALNLNIPLNPEKAVKALAKDALAMPIDLGKVNQTRKFINTVSIGMDAEINEKAIALKARLYKLRMPVLCYIPAIWQSIRLKHSWPLVSVYLDKDLFFRGEATAISVTNTPGYGVGFTINPQAKLNDGKLNLCVFKRVRELALPYYILRMILKNHHLIRDRFLLQEFTKARITSSEPMPLQVDGEPAGLTREITISILPEMANFLYIPHSS